MDLLEGSGSYYSRLRREGVVESVVLRGFKEAQEEQKQHRVLDGQPAEEVQKERVATGNRERQKEGFCENSAVRPRGLRCRY